MSDQRSDSSLGAVFGALSDPIRRGMLTRLAHGPCSVSGLGEPYAVSAPAISKHLRVLEGAGLIGRWKSGRVHYCRLLANPLRQAGDWIDEQQRFWEQQFDALEDFLNKKEGAWTSQGSDRPASPSGSGASSTRPHTRSTKPGPGRKR